MTKFLLFFSFRAMSEGADTAHSAPVSNAGLVTTNLTPASSVPMTGVAPQPPHPVPLFSIPSHSNSHIPIQGGAAQVSSVNVGDPNNPQPRIPPLMGIRPSDTFINTLPPHPPVHVPATVPPSGISQTTGEMSATPGGGPRLEGPPQLQRRGQELDHDEDSDGEDSRGGEPISQKDLA